MSNPKSEDVVRSHMSYSLKNKATNWYDSELTSLEKEALRVLPLEQNRMMEATPPYTHHHYQEAPNQGDSQAAASRSLNQIVEHYSRCFTLETQEWPKLPMPELEYDGPPAPASSRAPDDPSLSVCPDFVPLLLIRLYLVCPRALCVLLPHKLCPVDKNSGAHVTHNDPVDNLPRLPLGEDLRKMDTTHLF
ncbi:hypothetical protein N7465_005172 [Penicillium sp. CMV-2018d]|nr:hypothetical protein N7465_005172 [Penicillium sp. CMV-2018d]